MRDTCDGEGIVQTTNSLIVGNENYSGKINWKSLVQVKAGVPNVGLV